MIDNDCECTSCTERRRKAAGGRCRACDGTGEVASATGERRPCSRCQNEAFSRWSSNQFKAEAAHG